jgi:uncharacterized membrane protein YcaP (DUF421 family)
MEAIMSEHYEVIIRSISAFIILLLGSRLLGKQTISQMNNFNFIAAISIGAITANLCFNTRVKIPDLILAYVIFILTVYIISYVSLKSRKARKFLAGNPTVVVQNGKILENNMKKMHYTIDYLNQQLREKDVFNINEVLFALLEPNGTISVVKKPQFRPVTIQDLHLKYTKEGMLPIELIMDGKFVDKNIIENGLTYSWLESEIQNRGLKISDIVYAVLLSEKELYIDCYNDYIHSPIDAE